MVSRLFRASLGDLVGKPFVSGFPIGFVCNVPSILGFPTIYVETPGSGVSASGSLGSFEGFGTPGAALRRIPPHPSTSTRTLPSLPPRQSDSASSPSRLFRPKHLLPSTFPPWRPLIRVSSRALQL